MSTIIKTMKDQIGIGNILAISGGRVIVWDENTIDLPVHAGYKVRVEYKPVPDTYTVQRIFQRGPKIWVKGEATNVYCDEVGEVAFKASCYLDEFGN